MGSRKTGIQLRVAAGLWLLPVLALWGCASGSRGAVGGGDQALRVDPNHITEEEVERYRQEGVRDLAHLVQQARPRWLRIPPGSRSVYGSTATTILVYRDGRLLGGLETLQRHEVTGVRELRWLNAAEADVLPGAGNRHVHGAIMIITAMQ